MDKMIIPVHSVVDVITNSSTMIYTGATDEAVSAVRAIINHVLLEAGSDKRVDDLYDVKFVKWDDDDDDWRAKEAANSKLPSGEFADSAMHAESYVSIELKRKGYPGLDISEQLGKLFYVREDYG